MDWSDKKEMAVKWFETFGGEEIILLHRPEQGFARVDTKDSPFVRSIILFVSWRKKKLIVSHGHWHFQGIFEKKSAGKAVYEWGSEHSF